MLALPGPSAASTAGTAPALEAAARKGGKTVRRVMIRQRLFHDSGDPSIRVAFHSPAYTRHARTWGTRSSVRSECPSKVSRFSARLSHDREGKRDATEQQPILSILNRSTTLRTSPDSTSARCPCPIGVVRTFFATSAISCAVLDSVSKQK